MNFWCIPCFKVQIMLDQDFSPVGILFEAVDLNEVHPKVAQSLIHVVILWAVLAILPKANNLRGRLQIHGFEIFSTSKSVVIPASLQWPITWFFHWSMFLKLRNSHWLHFSLLIWQEKKWQLKSCLRIFNKPPQHLAPQSPVCPHPSWGLALPQPSWHTWQDLQLCFLRQFVTLSWVKWCKYKYWYFASSTLFHVGRLVTEHKASSTFRLVLFSLIPSRARHLSASDSDPVLISASRHFFVSWKVVRVVMRNCVTVFDI